MAFSIRVLDEPAPKPGVRFGLITIGDFEERFEMAVGFWQPEDYRTQWKQAAARILRPRSMRRARRSAFITSMADPANANFITWWPAYREGERVVFQNQLLFLRGKPLDPANPYRRVGPRHAVSDDGHPLSEWDASLSDLETFWQSL